MFQKMKRKIITLILALAMILVMFPTSALAFEFTDMPDNWSTTALENAVVNGLLEGFGNDKIMPQAYLTRAQMAAVVNRAFGTKEKASLSSYSDVLTDAWYYDDMAKAVQMKTFVGAGDKLNPENNITREEAFVVLARAFRLSGANTSVLNVFSDKAMLSEWAVDEVASLIAGGYIVGNNGAIHPAQYITRAEFASMMDNLLKTYLKTPGTYTTNYNGNVMINETGITLKNITITGDLIIGDGVGDGEVILDHVVVTGRTLIRGGGVNSIKILGDSVLQNITIARVDGVVRVYTEDGTQIGDVIADGYDDILLEGYFGNISILASGITVTANNAVIHLVTIDGENSNVIENAGSAIVKIIVNGLGSSISGQGELGSVEANANNTIVTVPGAIVTAAFGTNGVLAGNAPVVAGSSVTVASVLTDTLAAAKTTAHDMLANALANYTEANYTPANWAALTGFKDEGDAAIDSALDLTAITSAKNAATSGMAGVVKKTTTSPPAEPPTNTLAAAKTTAHGVLTTALTTYTEANYTLANWIVLTGFKTTGDTAIDAALDLAAVTSAQNTATAGMTGVETIAATLAAAKTTAHGVLTTTLATYTEANYTLANWIVLTGFKTTGDTAIDAALDLAAVTSAQNTATAGMTGVETIAQTLAAAKVTAHGVLTTALATYTEANYTLANWIVLTGFKTTGDTAIDAALNLAAVTSAQNTATAGMTGVETIAQTLAAAKVTAHGVLTTALATYTEANYTLANWIALTGFKTAGDTAIDAALDLAAVTSAQNTATAGMTGVETIAATLAAAKTTAHGVLTTALATYTEANYTPANWIVLTSFKTTGDTAIDAALDLAAVTSAQNTATAGMTGVETIAATLAAAKTTAHGVLTTALATYTEANYTPANWIALTGFKTTGDTAIDAALDLAAVTSAQNTATAGMTGVETIAATLAAAKVTAHGVLTTALATYTEANYTLANWIALTGFKTAGDTAINAALDLTAVTSAQNTATSGMAGVETSVAAVGVATAVSNTSTITYTLTTGAFDAAAGIVINNWTLGGTAASDLGDITSIALSNNNKTATISISGTAWAFTVDYTIAPAQAAFTVDFIAPAAEIISVLDPMAAGNAMATTGTQTISFALTIGTFDSIEGIVVDNWILGGANASDLGIITSISLTNSNKTANLTVSGMVGANTMVYTLTPANAMFATFGYSSPGAVVVSILSDPLAIGEAKALAGRQTITYTLLTGAFNPIDGLIVSNWILGGIAPGELGAVTNVLLSNENKTATLTVAGGSSPTVIAYTTEYTIAPSQATFIAGFIAPSAATITVLDPWFLDTAIAAANEAKVDIIISADGTDVLPRESWVTQAVNDTLDTAISTAVALLTTETSELEFLNAATVLDQATAAYQAAIITVPVTLSSIAITTPATKTTYTINDLLDIKGLVVTGTYNDSHTTVEPITAANITGFNSTSPVIGQSLTITVGGKITTYQINIIKVTLNKTTTSMLLSMTDTLTATVLPLDAPNKNVTWAAAGTSNTVSVVNGLVTGLKLGIATVTVTTVDGGIKASCFVTVTNTASILNNFNLGRSMTYMPGLITQFGDAIGLNLPDYSLMNADQKLQVQQTMIDAPSFATLADIKNVFDQAVVSVTFDEINYAAVDTMAAALNNNAAVLALDLTSYNLLTAQTQTIVNGYLLLEIYSTGFYTTALDLQTDLDLAVLNTPAAEAALAEINNATAAALGESLVNNAALLGLNLDSYVLFTDQLTVNTSLDSKEFTNSYDLQIAIDTILYDLTVDVLNQINMAAMDTIAAVITDNATAFGLDLTNYNSLSPAGQITVQGYLVYTPYFVSSYNNIAEVHTAFNLAVTNAPAAEAAFAEINAATVDTIDTALTNNAALLGLFLDGYGPFSTNELLITQEFTNSYDLQIAIYGW